MISHLNPQAELWPNLVRWLAILALVLGLGVWWVRLAAPVAQMPAPLLLDSGIQDSDPGAVARWFSGAELRVKVALSGVMADGQGFGSALLSVNGAPVRAFRSGEVLVPGVILDSVWADYVVIDQDGRREQVDMVRAPAGPVNGFIAVP